MARRRGMRRLFGLDRISLRGLAIILFTLIFLGFLVIFGAMKIMDTAEKYNTKYYDPKDFQREEMIKKEVEKK